MNRRGFIKALAATVFIPPLCSSSPKLLATERRGPISPVMPFGKQWVLNPEYRDAPYEIGFLLQKGSQPEAYRRIPYPLRFHTAEDAEYFMSKIV
jgi:hypothetical protein